jgi:hypothetical protein
MTIASRAQLRAFARLGYAAFPQMVPPDLIAAASCMRRITLHAGGPAFRTRCWNSPPCARRSPTRLEQNDASYGNVGRRIAALAKSPS